MSEYPTEEDIRELEAFGEPFSLSIYVPHLDPNTADNPNRIELKNLLREARTALESTGLEERIIRKTLRPARELLDSREFWPVQRGSLALFSHPGLFRHFRLPEQGVPYMVTVEQGFNLDPLKASMADNKQYVVLALGHQDVRVYEGDRYRLREVQFKKFPTDLKQELNIDEYPSWQETHQIAPASTGKGSRAYHGQYNISQTDKDMLLEFFRRIDRHLHKFLLDKQVPLIVAGVSYVQPIYRQANTYKHLLPEGIGGNVDRADVNGIREAAWSILEKENT